MRFPLESTGPAVRGRLSSNLMLLCALASLAACGADTPTSAPGSGSPAAAADDGLPHSTPAAEGIDTAQLRSLVFNANFEASDAVVLLRNGKLVYENYYSQGDVPILSESVSKSFVSLAFGYLLAEQKLSSLDVHVVDVLPTFAGVDARKRDITIRELLAQTSGIDPTRASYVSGVATDVEARAIASRLVYPPGTGWQYSNNGYDVLGVVFHHLAGEPIDSYLQRKLFTPMGITSVSWVKDSKGEPVADYGMSIRPLDLAKVGQAILDGGVWQGTQVIPPDWLPTAFAQSQVPEPNYGLGWWRVGISTTAVLTEELLTQWQAMGFSPQIVGPLVAIAGKPYPSVKALQADEHLLLGDSLYTVLSNIIATGDHVPAYRLQGFSWLGNEAEGWLGQYLVMFPDKHLVGVRMRRPFQADYINVNAAVHTDGAFPGDVYYLVP